MKNLSSFFNLSSRHDKRLLTLINAIEIGDTALAQKHLLELVILKGKDPLALDAIEKRLQKAELDYPAHMHALYKTAAAYSKNTVLQRYARGYYEDYLHVRLEGKGEKEAFDFIVAEIKDTPANSVMREAAIKTADNFIPSQITQSYTKAAGIVAWLSEQAASGSFQESQLVKQWMDIIGRIGLRDPVQHMGLLRFKVENSKEGSLIKSVAARKIVELEKTSASAQPVSGEGTQPAVFRPYTDEEREAMIKLGAPPKSGSDDISMGLHP